MKKAYFQMHLAIFLWGFTGVFGRAIEMSEGMIVWYRMIISAIGLLPLVLTLENRLPPMKEVIKITGVGTLVALHWVLFYGSIKASNISVALICFSTVSLFTAVIDPIIHRKRPKMPEIILSLFVIAGLYMIFTVRQGYLTGIILAVSSAFLGALFTILNKNLTKIYPAEQITFYELLSGFIILTLLLPLYFTTTGTGFELPGQLDWLWLLLLGLVCTSFAFTISLKALKKLDAFTLNLSVNLEPLYSILLAFIIFNETEILNSGFIAGTLIIVGSVVVHSYHNWKSNRA